MRAHVVAVGPDAGVWIIDEVNRVGQEVIKVVLTRCIRRGGDSEALVGIAGLPCTHNELREHPAAREDVVRNDGVAVIVRRAGAA